MNTSALELIPLKKNINERTGLKSLRGLTFDDVTILPAKTNVRPDMVCIKSEVLKNLVASVPVFSAPMQTVWSIEMTCALAEFGAVGPITRDLTLVELGEALTKIHQHKIDLKKYPSAAHKNGRPYVVVAASPFDQRKLEILCDDDRVDYIMLDTVQPYNDEVLFAVEEFSKRRPYSIAVGNVVTAEAAYEFCRYPIAGLKVGLGPGSICTTREISGVGVPQLEAISEVASVAKENNIPVIADGGIRTCGDIAKAIAAGADSVMMGRLFAGTHEAPGEIINQDGGVYKFYAGSKYNSVELNTDTADDVLDSFIENIFDQERRHRVEGVSGLTPLTGPAKLLLLQIKRSLGASFAFTGAKAIHEFRERTRFIQVSPSAMREGAAHGLSFITHSNQIFKNEGQ